MFCMEVCVEHDTAKKMVSKGWYIVFVNEQYYPFLQ